jgi:hypothetical protein
MRQVVIENPVINSPYLEPTRHFKFTDDGITDEIVESRRISSYFIPEETLMFFYQARDAIRDIRSPFIRVGEGCTRKKSDNETSTETELLNRAYIVMERFEKKEDIFNKLTSTKYKFMARFGKESEEPFGELNGIIKEIFVAAYALGNFYWPRQGNVHMEENEFKNHLKEKHEYEAVIWDWGGGRDKISKKVDEIITKVETITKDEISEKEVWFKKIF